MSPVGFLPCVRIHKTVGPELTCLGLPKNTRIKFLSLGGLPKHSYLNTYASVVGPDPRGSGSAWIRIIFGSWIRIRIEVESWIRIGIKEKSKIWIRIRWKGGRLRGSFWSIGVSESGEKLVVRSGFASEWKVGFGSGSIRNTERTLRYCTVGTVLNLLQN